MARLFFALWPDAAAADALARLARDLGPRVGGKPVPATKIHLTLAFLGEVAERAGAAAVPVAGRAFVISVDCVGAFRGARVAWAGIAQPPAALVDLQSRLAAQLRAAGFELEDRPFVPHLTLARRIAAPLPRVAIAPIGWQAREVALMRSEAGTGRYTRLETWELPG